MSSGGTSVIPFGQSADYVSNRLLAGDYDGDGKDDIAFWRSAAQGFFFIINSSNGTVRQDPFGTTGDDPRVVNDYDGDGRTDVAVYRGGAQSIWFYRASANNPAGNITFVPWGTTGDFANPGDTDGDGKGDFTVQRSNTYWILKSSGGFTGFQHGLGSDFVAPGDYDGDGKVDICAIRSEGSNRVWYPLRSLDSTVSRIVWGPLNARTQGDFDGDGKTDVGVWISTAPSTYWILPSNGGPSFTFEWGLPTDISVNAYNVR